MNFFNKIKLTGIMLLAVIAGNDVAAQDFTDVKSLKYYNGLNFRLTMPLTRHSAVVSLNTLKIAYDPHLVTEQSVLAVKLFVSQPILKLLVSVTICSLICT